MRLNKLHQIGRIAALAVLLVGLPVSALAETVTDNSNANISFEENTGPTKPVNPDNPDEDLDPDLPGAEGALAIVYVSDFDFTGGKVSTGTQFFDITTSRPNLQVVDLRGARSGWNVEVSIDGFQNTQSNRDSLIGANLHIYNGWLNSNTAMTSAPAITKNVKLTTDDTPARLLTADTDKGMGLWVDRFYPDPAGEDKDISYVQLEVPAGSASPGSHRATITWYLSDTPS